MTKLWSKRLTVGYGWIWKCERECQSSEAEQWLAVYKKDEPAVLFTIANNKPR